MKIIDRERKVNHLLDRINQLEYAGIGQPEVLFQDVKRIEKELEKYRNRLKNTDYIDRVENLLLAIGKRRPYLEARAKEEKKKRQLHLERKAVLASQAIVSSKPPKTTEIKRRIPRSLGMGAWFSKHNAKPARLINS